MSYQSLSKNKLVSAYVREGENRKEYLGKCMCLGAEGFFPVAKSRPRKQHNM